MTLDPSKLFPSLEPPPGGLAALRARLASDRRLPLAWAAAAACGLAGVLLLVVWCRPSPRGLRDELVQRDYPAMVALGLSAAPEEPVTLLPSPGQPRTMRRVSVSDTALVVYVVEGHARDSR